MANKPGGVYGQQIRYALWFVSRFIVLLIENLGEAWNNAKVERHPLFLSLSVSKIATFSNSELESSSQWRARC